MHLSKCSNNCQMNISILYNSLYIFQYLGVNVKWFWNGICFFTIALNPSHVHLYIVFIYGVVFKLLIFFKKRKLPKLNEFPEKLRFSNINVAMHKLLVGWWMSDGSEKRPLTKMLWSVSFKTRTFASVNTCNGSF